MKVASRVIKIIGIEFGVEEENVEFFTSNCQFFGAQEKYIQ
jgi:hypothetical protein